MSAESILKFGVRPFVYVAIFFGVILVAYAFYHANEELVYISGKDLEISCSRLEKGGSRYLRIKSDTLPFTISTPGRVANCEELARNKHKHAEAGYHSRSKAIYSLSLDGFTIISVDETLREGWRAAAFMYAALCLALSSLYCWAKQKV